MTLKNTVTIHRWNSRVKAAYGPPTHEFKPGFNVEGVDNLDDGAPDDRLGYGMIVGECYVAREWTPEGDVSGRRVFAISHPEIDAMATGYDDLHDLHERAGEVLQGIEDGDPEWLRDARDLIDDGTQLGSEAERLEVEKAWRAVNACPIAEDNRIEVFKSWLEQWRDSLQDAMGTIEDEAIGSQVRFELISLFEGVVDRD